MPARVARLLGPFFALLVAAGPTVTAAPEPSGWYRVQFDGRIASADRAALEGGGAQSLLYAHPNAYLAWLEAGALERTQSLPGIRSVRLVPPREKLDASLSEGTKRNVVALVHGDGISEVRGGLAGFGRVVNVAPLPHDGPLFEATIAVDPAELTSLLRRPDVLFVGPAIRGFFPEDEGTAQIVANNLDFLENRPMAGYLDWLKEVGLDGSGVTVAITDSGIDESHPDLAGRVVKPVDYSSLPAGEPVDSLGHGTHVTGIVGGSGAAFSAQGGARDLSGFLYGLGVAPSVRFLDQNILATSYTGDWPPANSYGFGQLTRDALAEGAAIWNASWNTGEPFGYLESSRVIDMLVRDADLLTLDVAEPFTMVFSAGNAGPSPRTLTSPHEAKNIITVASTRSQRFTENGTQRRGDIDVVSDFSSRGPGQDGRILPTIAAPGEIVVSTKSLPHGGLCFQPPQDGNSYGHYSICSGTSMAAPHVTGSVALITEWWREFNGKDDPSPAMAKALLVNTSKDIGVSDIPNPNEGWGRVNLGALFDRKTRRIYRDQTIRFTEIDRRWQIPVRLVDPNKPLKVTLVWTDAPGTPSDDPTDPALVNDLDLTVHSPFGRFFGNIFEGGWSSGVGKRDRLNNIENVFIAYPDPGTYRITVSAHNLPGDGVPLTGDRTDQDFAVVISNAVRA